MIRSRKRTVVVAILGLVTLWRILGIPSGRGHRPRLLVVLLGNLRCGEKAWQTLYDHVLDINGKADLALLIGDIRDEYHNATLISRARFVWKFDEYVDWADAIDEIRGTEWRKTFLPLISESNALFGGILGHDFQGSGAIIFVLRWFLARRLVEVLDDYDLFMITRSDHYYRCDHYVLDMDPNYLWVPMGEDYDGITDRHMIAGRGNILSALNILPPMLEDPRKYASIVGDETMNPEQLIAHRWQEDGLEVRRFARVMFTCAASGDTTRWKKMGSEVWEGVFLKYYREYIASYETCGLPVGLPPPSE